MTTKQVYRVIHRSPREPFRLLLDDGEEILVRQPRKALVAGDRIACEGESRRQGKTTPPRLRIIQVNRVVAAENIEVVP